MKHILPLLILCAAWGSYAQKLVEICPSNVTAFEGDNEDFSDWIEVFNETGDELDLEGYYFTDNPLLPEKWEIPEIELETDAYFVFSADDWPVSDSTIAFSFGRQGGRIYLSNPSGVIIDSIVYPVLQPDDSYGIIGEKWYFFDDPSPEEANNESTGFKGYASRPIVNRISGYYSSGTNIAIRPQLEDETVYYSLNGTDPVTANNYDTPLILNGNMALRTRSIADSMIASPSVYRTYLVDIQHEIPIAHISVDSLELLDEIIGIYVLGPDADEEFPFFGANFWKDIEINAYLNYFDSEMILRESVNCGLKIHGGTVSTTQPMKSLRLVAHDRFEQEEFQHIYFENKPVKDFRRLLLRNSGSDYNKTHLKDGVLHKFILDHGLNVDVQAYQPVVVYINGYYWGVHNLREKIDRYYCENNYNVHPDSVNLLEEEELILISGDSADFVELRDYVLANDMNNAVHYNWVAERLDLESMVDYFIMELYVNNRDWPYNNLKLWNSAQQPKWRYFYSDLDAGLRYYGTDQIDLHSLAYILGPFGDNNVHVAIFKQLLSNQEFRRYFINRYADLMNTILAEDYFLDYIYRAKAVIEPEMEQHFDRWFGSFEQWHNKFNDFDEFLENRVAIVQNELSIVFEKDSAVDVYVGMYPANAGLVDLNTIQLDSFPFVGKYFPDNQIDLTVKPNGTYEFLHWENLRTGEITKDFSIQLDPHLGDSLIAIFNSSEDPFQLTLFPNPIKSSGQLGFSIQESGPVSIHVFDLSGQFMAQLDFAYLAKGSYARRFDFSHLKPGTYLVQVESNNNREALQFVKVNP